MARLVEEVFVTEGIPQETFVEPPNYGLIMVDIRHPGKPVIVEGQSGTGKTTTVKKILSHISGKEYEYLSARRTKDVEFLINFAERPEKRTVIIDDFHRLSDDLQTRLIDIAKLAAEEASTSDLPKLILIGINQVGSHLIQFVPDIAKRVGIHRIQQADENTILALVDKGCAALNIVFPNKEIIYEESAGDYWLTQQLCQASCTLAKVYEEKEQQQYVIINKDELRRQLVTKLHSAYHPAIKEFCRGRRFRPSNDPYYKLLRAVAVVGQSNIELTKLATEFPDIKTSINNIKDQRLKTLLESKSLSERYFYYDSESTQFAIEDPAVFYYLQHLNWEELRKECGFKTEAREYQFDIAISFAGENRELAKFIADKLEELDVRVFYDERYEANYLGKALSKEFTRIFVEDSRFVVCLLDQYHNDKIWPTFERECFVPRIPDGEVLPIYLDDTKFVGIPKDLLGIKFAWDPTDEDRFDAVLEDIIFKIIDRIG